MQAWLVVGVQTLTELLAGLPWAGLIVEIYMLVLDAAPEPFGAHIIACSTFPIPTDPHLGRQQQARECVAGKLAALLGGSNRWRGLSVCLARRLQHKRQFQCVIERPTHAIARELIQDDHQKQPAITQTHIRDSAAPDVIGIRRGDIQ
jgi:hypothetical protein